MVLGMGWVLFGQKETAHSVLSYASILLLGTGALLWCIHITERIIDPSGFAHGSNTPYLFLVYSIFTIIGLLLFGILLLKTSLGSWTGWMFIAGSIIILGLMVLFKDMPPFVYYLLTLIFSFALF